RIAILAIGYADGLVRSLSSGSVDWQGNIYPLAGRISMDLTAFAIPIGEGPAEGEWVSFAFDPPSVAVLAGRSQYEILTGTGQRYQRVWA
ncbi:MAG: alanine racemase, partial [Lysobacteraceae bacterium]